MNAEHQALAEYLEGRITGHMDHRFDQVRNEFKAEFKEVHRRINSQIEFVDTKNEEQDEEIEMHEIRIRALESTIT